MKPTSPPAGKKVFTPTWQLDMSFRPVLSVDDQLEPIDLAKKYQDLSCHDNIRIKVEYDNILLIESSIKDCFHYSKKILDDKENCDHSLFFTLSGKTDDHSLKHDGKSLSVGLFVNLWIENIEVTHLLPQYGVLGTNGCLSFQLQTPIYRWLLNNKQQIIPKCNQIYTEIC